MDIPRFIVVDLGRLFNFNCKIIIYKKRICRGASAKDASGHPSF